MASNCQELMDYASAGVAPALRAVDCAAGEATASAFNRLFGAEGAMAPVLVSVLTLYIVFFAISLLLGRSRLGVSALTPRMLLLGFVVTFATSWIAYQSVVWNLAVGGPDWIASLLMGTKGSATQIFGDRIDIIFNALTQVGDGSGQDSGGLGDPGTAATTASGAAGAAAAGGAATGGAAGGQAASASLMSPQGIMWMGGLVLLLGTVGVLLTARIALAVLLALGPVFMIFALFDGTRGLTAGWLRGVVMTAITPLFVVLAGGISLELLVPVVAQLVKGAELGEIDARSAVALFLMACVHMALMVMVFKVAGTMVGNWQVFGMARRDRDGRDVAPQPALIAPASHAPVSPPPLTARAAVVPAAATNAAAAGGQHISINEAEAAGRASDRRSVVTHVSGGGLHAAATSDTRRAHGIGSRFRSASNDSGRLAAKEIKS